MKDIKYSDGLFSIEGAVSIEDNSDFTATWRIDCSKKEFYYPPKNTRVFRRGMNWNLQKVTCQLVNMLKMVPHLL